MASNEAQDHSGNQPDAPSSDAAANSAETAPGQPTQQQRKAMNHAILTQVFGATGLVAFNNGLILLYLTVLEISSEMIVVYLAMPAVIDALFLLPLAYWADRLGRKRMGVVGGFLQAIGFAMLAFAPSFPSLAMHAMLFSGTLVICFGMAMFGAGWFALLMPLVPDAVRGRFFGRLRTSWQLVATGLFVIMAFVLTEQSESGVFQAVLVIVTLLMFIRLIFYFKLPEMEKPDRAINFFRALFDGLRAPGFMAFSAYCFLLLLFAHVALPLFGLIEKRELGLGDNVVVWLNIATMIGMLGGFFLGGKAVDRWGTRAVFVVVHFAFAISLLMFLSRGFWFDLPVVVPLAISHVVYGVAFAASTIAVSTELLALVLPAYKALSISACRALQRAGTGLSGLLTAVALKLGLLADHWEFAGETLSRYDTLLLASAVMLILLVVALGLVPSVLKPHEYVPR